MDAKATVQAFFSDTLLPCQKDDDCFTGVCDLTTVYSFNTVDGFCAGFPTAYDRWQRKMLAGNLADLARKDPQVRSWVLERVDQELGQSLAPVEEETLLLLLDELGGEDAMARAEKLLGSPRASVGQLAGLVLASGGREEGLEAVVAAAFSPVIRVRMHAAHAACGLCSGPTLGVLQELLEDDHYLVRRAAAHSLARCGGEKAAGVLRHALQKLEEDGDPADRFMLESALYSVGGL